MKSRLIFTIDVEHELEYDRHNSSALVYKLENVLYRHRDKLKDGLTAHFNSEFGSDTVKVLSNRLETIADLEEEESYKNFDKAVISHAIDELEGRLNADINGSELHNELFNQSYFVIGYYYADKYLDSYGVFAAIEEIVKYEKLNFGEVGTSLDNSEKVVNVLAYIKGEELLQDSEINSVLEKHWDKCLPKSSLKKVLKLLKEKQNGV